MHTCTRYTVTLYTEIIWRPADAARFWIEHSLQ
eukprot:COSAG01_NODE_53982_length_335_cov_0.872881_1_plen_32_part_10